MSNSNDHEPAQDTSVSVCFQFITKGGAVVDSEPELWDSIALATARAEEWMNLGDQKTISFISFEGDGAVVRVGEIEHVAVIPSAKMAALYATYHKAAEEAAFSTTPSEENNS